MGSYFCGWYYRSQSAEQTLAVIPSVHRTGNDRFCAIQVITDRDTFYARFPHSAFHAEGRRIWLENNVFSPEGIRLDIRRPGLEITGSLAFGPFTPLGYDIMGPFRYVPFLQCRHRVYSMHHSVNGSIRVNGESFVFRDATGYLEGDRGRSFPKEYAWVYGRLPRGALMLSVAHIPLAGLHFTGIIGAVLLDGKEYRLATYLGARAISLRGGELRISQGRQRLTIRLPTQTGHPLRAPVEGAMSRTVRETPSGPIFCRFEDHGTLLLDTRIPNASFEYEY